MKTKQYTVGEIAAATGLTVRTLQHYDNIGLLPVSERTEGGRRLYTHNDLLKLEQIIFFKSVGIPLKSIEKMLRDTQSLSELESVLNNHYRVLLQRIDAFNFSKSVLDSSLEIIKAGKYPPWEMLTYLIRTMEGSSISNWDSYEFENKLYETLDQQKLTTIDGVMELYHSMRAIMVEAVTLQEVKAAPDSTAAQKLAANWWNLIMSLTNGDDGAVSALSAVNDARETWPIADRFLYEKAEPFLEAVLEVYIRKNNIPVPNALTTKEEK